MFTMNSPSYLIFLLVATMVLSFQCAFAQDKGVIDAQRPTLTESFSIVKLDIVQFETGVDFFTDPKSTSLATFVRGSVSDRVELRVASDFSSLNLAGLKFVVLTPENNLLKLGASMVYGRFLLTEVNDFRFVVSRSFDKLFFSYNFGHDERFYNILLAGYPLTKKLNCFVEYYNEPMHHQLHSGITYILGKDFQFDLNGGWIDSKTWYFGTGFSFRIR